VTSDEQSAKGLVKEPFSEKGPQRKTHHGQKGRGERGKGMKIPARQKGKEAFGGRSDTSCEMNLF